MDDVFAILADPTRRRILGVLKEGEHSVNELVEAVDYHQPGVSRHLRILHDAELVSVHKDANRRIYSIRPGPLREVDEWIDEYRSLLVGRLDRLAAHLAGQEEEMEEEDDDDEQD